jgi:SAM-dependent methyltransferase
VRLFAGDIHDLDVTTLGGPFDLAFTRLFLVHQADPVRTLRHIAALLRPGGCVVAHEALLHPPPRSQPPIEALPAYWLLIHEMIERTGTPHALVADLPRSARAAGLEVEAAEGFFPLFTPELGFNLHSASMAAARDRAASPAQASQIDEIVATLRSANPADYEWVSAPFFLDLRLRKPA